MTHVERAGPWETGTGGIEPDQGPASELDAPPDPAAAPAHEVHGELLMGFLTDFHAASREPPPEPEPPAGASMTSGASHLSRFDFAPADPLEAASGFDMPPAAPLPVWPPVPQSEPAPTPAAAAAPEPEPADSGRRGVSVFRRRERR